MAIARSALAALALAAAASGCATGRFTDADRAAIVRVSEEWFAAAAAADTARVAATYAPDAVLLPSGGAPVRGSEAIAAHFAGFPPLANVRFRRMEVEGRGDLAYAWGTYAMDLLVPGAPAPVAESGTYVEIWRRQPDGAWRIARDIYTSARPAAGAE
jgi:uncharacterized protein (TIGR02246 family)